jgi:hypothetical protein
MVVGVVIMIIPIPVSMPTMRIFIPPSVGFAPATLPCLLQFMPPSICLLTLGSVVLNGFMQLMVGLFGPTLAIIIGSERLCAS